MSSTNTTKRKGNEKKGGAAASTASDVKKTKLVAPKYERAALLVIDVQGSFPHKDYYQEKYLPDFMKRLQTLVDGAETHSIPIIQVFHVEEEGPFSKASGNIHTLEPLKINPDVIIEKQRHSAFIGSSLGVYLTENKITRLFISGIRSEQCCETTTRHGWDLGYTMDYVSDATATFDMKHPDGTPMLAPDIIRRSETVLHGRFATVRSVEEALKEFAKL